MQPRLSKQLEIEKVNSCHPRVFETEFYPEERSKKPASSTLGLPISENCFSETTRTNCVQLCWCAWMLFRNMLPGHSWPPRTLPEFLFSWSTGICSFRCDIQMFQLRGKGRNLSDSLAWHQFERLISGNQKSEIRNQKSEIRNQRILQSALCRSLFLGPKSPKVPCFIIFW